MKIRHLSRPFYHTIIDNFYEEEELKKVLWEAWPEKTGPVKTYPKPDSTKDYRKETPQR